MTKTNVKKRKMTKPITIKKELIIKKEPKWPEMKENFGHNDFKNGEQYGWNRCLEACIKAWNACYNEIS